MIHLIIIATNIEFSVLTTKFYADQGYKSFIHSFRDMELILRPIFNVLTIPDLKIKKPSWITTPSPWTIFTFILLSYFLVTGMNVWKEIIL